MKKTKTRTKKTRKIRKRKKLDDFRNQNLKIIFEDITSHKREVKEIEELTFKQLQNLRKRLDSAITRKIPIPSFSNEEDEEKKEEE